MAFEPFAEEIPPPEAASGMDRPDPAARGRVLAILGLLILLPLAINILLGTLGLTREIKRFLAIRLIYNFNTFYLPLGLAGAALAGAMLRSRLAPGLRLGRTLGGCLAVAGLLLLVRLYASGIEPERLQVRRVVIQTAKVKAPLRILHITDIQAPGVGDYERRAVGLMQALKPDLVIHTGDLIQLVRPARMKKELPKMDALLRTLTPPLGKFNVIGDVDRRAVRKALAGGLGGMRTLRNEEAVIEAPGCRIRIFGLTRDTSAGWDEDTEQAATRWLKGTRPEELTILIGHRPDFILSVADLPIDLCLAGHTHGGQICLPFWGPLVTFSKVPREWARGYRPVGRTRLDVSAGVGSEHVLDLPAIRVNCPPEMTLIELVPAPPADRRR